MPITTASWIAQTHERERKKTEPPQTHKVYAEWRKCAESSADVENRLPSLTRHFSRLEKFFLLDMASQWHIFGGFMFTIDAICKFSDVLYDRLFRFLCSFLFVSAFSFCFPFDLCFVLFCVADSFPFVYPHFFVYFCLSLQQFYILVTSKNQPNLLEISNFIRYL